MEVMSSADVPTVDLHGAIVEKCGAVPQKACFGKPGCFSPHCGAKNEWVAFRLHLCCVIYLDKPHRGPPQRKLKHSIPFFGTCMYICTVGGTATHIPGKPTEGYYWLAQSVIMPAMEKLL